jgi:glucosamine--fructose-6-phosphate aminotransferase (isomerizing)
MLTGIVPSEIAEEPAAIRATLTEALPAARESAAALLAAGTRRVVVVGNGTSYHSSLAAATLYSRHAGPDDPIVVARTAADLRIYGPALGRGDALLGISASGEFRDVVALAEELRGRVPTVGVIHVAGSSLDGIVDHAVRSAGGPSRAPVMTKTYVATLTAACLVALELLGERRAAPVEAAIRAVADATEAALAAAADRVPPLADALAATEHLFVVGAGAGVPAAMEAALKLKEMALVHAEATEAWEMASGSATIVAPGTAVIALAPQGPGRDAVLDVARHSQEWGARVIEVGPAQAIDGADFLPLPGEAPEDLAPFAAVAPIALLAFELARRRGADPDRPGWIERYHSQGLRHIVGV